jgi:hypothetical protein
VLARGGKGATRREATGSGKVGEDEGEALRRASLPKKKKKKKDLAWSKPDMKPTWRLQPKKMMMTR